MIQGGIGDLKLNKTKTTEYRELVATHPIFVYKTARAFSFPEKERQGM